MDWFSIPVPSVFPTGNQCYAPAMPIEWKGIYRRYASVWIALGDDEHTVLASGKSPQEARQRAHAKGYEQPLIMRWPELLEPYVG